MKFKNMNSKNSKKDRMLLLGALPRSGNHLIRAALDNHSELLVPPGEDYFVRNLLRSRKYKILGLFLSKSSVRNFFKKVQKNGHFEELNSGENINLSSHSNLLDLEKYYELLERNHKNFSSKFSLIKNHFNSFFSSINWNQTKSEYAYKVSFCAMRPEENDLDVQFYTLSEIYDLKCIVVLRDPVKMISSVAGRNKNANIENLINRYNEFTKQVDKLKREHEHRLLVLSFEDFLENKARNIEKVCNFLGIKNEPILFEDTLLGKRVEKNTSFKQGASHTLTPEDIQKINKKAIQFNFAEN